MLTDLIMPQMGGVELVNELVQRRPDLPVVLMSGYAGEAVGEELLERPGVGFLQKPFSPEGLTRCVRGMLDHAAE